MKTWHNTTNESGVQLDLFNNRAEGLQIKIRNFMYQNRHKAFTPYEVFDAFNQSYLIGSIRRAMTNLSDDKIEGGAYLINTGIKVKERYNVSNYKWIWNSKRNEF